MAGTPNAIWCNEFLTHYAESVLQGISDVPRLFSVYRNPVALVATVPYASLGVDTTFEQDVSSLWTFSLGGNVLTAAASVSIVFPPSAAGNIYYGVVLYTADHKAAVFSPFGMPYVVPTGGTTLTIPAQLSFGDCSSNP